MGDRGRLIRAIAIAAAIGGCLAVPGVSSAVMKLKRFDTANIGPDPNFGIVRTANGRLQLVFPTTVARNGVDGVASKSITASGAIGPQVQALSGWQAGQTGLVALPNGTLAAVFGAISPAPNSVSSIWAIQSANAGATWSAPADVRSGPLEALAYGSPITAMMSGATPVLTVPQAGNLIIQRGFGPGSPTYQANGTSDGSVVDVSSAVDAASGEVVASWQSLATPGGLYVQGVAPTLGKPQLIPGQRRDALVIAGRDKGSGVFGAYTPDNNHVRLIRYGGGSVAVGSLNGLTAKTMGVATGLGGRIWVMWGDDSGGLAVTRSNKAATKFEPIQRLSSGAFTLYRLSGDGRLGPLDVFADEIPTANNKLLPPGSFYARVLPKLSASVFVTAVKNKQGKVVAHKLKVVVTDAGDPVAGAKVSAGGKSAKTNSSGIAKLTFPASVSGKLTVTVTDAGYQALQRTVTL